MWVCRAGQVQVSKLRKMCCFHLIANKNENFSFPLYTFILKLISPGALCTIPQAKHSYLVFLATDFFLKLIKLIRKQQYISTILFFGNLFLFAQHFDRQYDTDVKFIHFMLLKISFARTSYRPFFLHMMKMSQKGNLKIIINMFANNQWVCFFSLKT